MSVRDAINHALQDNPSELKNSIYSALDAKVADALELKKISTASEYFNMPEEEYEEEAEVEESLLGDPRHNPSAKADAAYVDAPTDKEIAAAKRRKEAVAAGRARRETWIGNKKMKTVIDRGLKHTPDKR